MKGETKKIPSGPIRRIRLSSAIRFNGESAMNPDFSQNKMDGSCQLPPPPKYDGLICEIVTVFKKRNTPVVKPKTASGL